MKIFTIGLLSCISMMPFIVSTPPDYIGSAKHFTTELSQRHFEEASKQFDEKMANTLPSKKLGEIWDGLLEKVGDFKQIIGTRAEVKQGYQFVFVTCAFAKTNLDLKIVFDSSAQIAGLFFVPPDNPTATWSPPAYVDQNVIHEESVVVGKNPWQLPGFLTLPNRRGPFPGVVLVQGSGP